MYPHPNSGALWVASTLVALALRITASSAETQSRPPLPAQLACDIPNETKRGVCVQVSQCAAYLQVRNVTNLTSERVNFLKKVQCEMETTVNATAMATANATETANITATAAALTIEDASYNPLVCCPANGQDYLYPVIQFTKFEYRRFLDVTARFKRKKLKRRIQTVEPSTGFNLLNECGKQVTNRIYGGEIAELDEYPWLALLVYHSSKLQLRGRDCRKFNVG